MRTRALLTSLVASAAVLVAGWQAGAQVIASRQPATDASAANAATAGATTAPVATATPTPTPTPSATTPPVTTGTTDSSTTGATSSGTTTTTTPTVADGTYTGDSVSTRFGSVQVSVTLSGGSITEVTALKLTDADGRSVQISNRAAPILHDEVIAAQSANVSMVGGATYTSAAYLQSVQSALDQAGF